MSMRNRSTDPWLIAIVSILIVLGLVMVYSASAVLAAEATGDEARYFSRQLISVVAGTILCVGTAVTPTRVFRRYRLLFYAACIFGLILCFIPGISNEVNGARRWIGFGSVNVQPSEFTKIAVLIWLAAAIAGVTALQLFGPPQAEDWLLRAGAIITGAQPPRPLGREQRRCLGRDGASSAASP